jgi:uncharacterized protein
MTRVNLKTGAAIAASVVFVMMGVFGMTAAVRSDGLQAQLKRDQLTLVMATGEQAISIEVAETMEQKAKGLMFRRSLDDKMGMLFPYGQPQEITMWMKNTYIPLDMVFLTSDGTVHRIAAMTEPFSEATVASQGPVSAVLELNGGAAARFGLKAGDKVRHPLFQKPKS